MALDRPEQFAPGAVPSPRKKNVYIYIYIYIRNVPEDGHLQPKAPPARSPVREATSIVGGAKKTKLVRAA